jgi:hypothetical protein
MKKIFIVLISIYTGFIANACIERILDSLARHGTISWADLIYPSKMVLLGVTLTSYRYLIKCLGNFEPVSLITIVNKGRFQIILLVMASALVFTQFNVYQIFAHPVKMLFFRW